MTTLIKKSMEVIALAFERNKDARKLTCVSEPKENESEILYLIYPDKLYTVKETAKILRIKVGTIYKWKCEKKIKSTKIGGKLLFKGCDIKEILK